MENEDLRRKHVQVVENMNHELEEVRQSVITMQAAKGTSEERARQIEQDLEASSDGCNKLEKARKQLEADLAQSRTRLAEEERLHQQERLDRASMEKQLQAQLDARNDAAARLERERDALQKLNHQSQEELLNESQKRQSLDLQRKKTLILIDDLTGRVEEMETAKSDLQRLLSSTQAESDALKLLGQKDTSDRVTELERIKSKQESELLNVHDCSAEFERQLLQSEKTKTRLTVELEDLQVGGIARK